MENLTTVKKTDKIGKSQDEEDTLEVREILILECINGFQAFSSVSLLSQSPSSPPQL
jgi:hypothetical protein